jgi:hypothetical protein
MLGHPSKIQPARGWKVFEAPGVEPVFPEKRQAIDYAQTRANFRSGEIRILDSTGKVERTIAFSEADRMLCIALPLFGPTFLLGLLLLAASCSRTCRSNLSATASKNRLAP